MRVDRDQNEKNTEKIRIYFLIYIEKVVTSGQFQSVRFLHDISKRHHHPCGPEWHFNQHCPVC